MKIVTGYTGQPHVTSNAAQGFNQGIFGTGNYVLNVGNKFNAVLTDVNTVTISDGEGVLQGVHFRIDPGTTEDVNIANGTTGYKRIDYICARYTKNALTGVESVNLVVVEGTPAASTPTAPTINTGDVLLGGSPVDFPLYEVDLDGLTPTLTSLYEVKATLDTETGVNHCGITGTNVSDGNFYYTIYKGMLIFSANIISNRSTTAFGTITIEDDIGAFAESTPFFVASSSVSSNPSVIFARCTPDTHTFRMIGSFDTSTTYYFSGVCRLKES